MDIKPARQAGDRPDAVVALSGAWRGRLVGETGVAESFNLERDTADPRLLGQFHLFTTPGGITAGARLLEAGERNFVVLIGPYLDAVSRRAVVTVLEGTLEADGMEGEFYTRRHGGREIARKGRFTASRTESVTRAA
jgi:hypothetical protein